MPFGGKGSGWPTDPGRRGSRGSHLWRNRHDTMRSEAAFRRPDRRTRTALAANRAIRQPGWGTAERREQRRRRMLQRGLVDMGEMTRKQAERAHPTNRQAVQRAVQDRKQGFMLFPALGCLVTMTTVIMSICAVIMSII